MRIEVVLPKVDMDMEAGVIAAWKVADGGLVRQGDILFEMETDKSLMEVESPGTGTIRGLADITGELIPVGTPVAWIDADADAASEPALPAAPPMQERSTPTPEGASPTANAAASTANAVTPAAAPVAAGSPDGGASREDLRATPSARRTARLRDVDLATISGSGPRGRIVANDVEVFADERDNAPAGGAAQIAPEATAPTQIDPRDGATGELVPFTPVRRIVAQRLAESVRTAPHFYLMAQVEMTALLEANRWLGTEIVKNSGVKLSVTVLLARIVGQMLRHHPLMNASIEGEATRLHPDAHIGIAMDRNGDLVVPVLRDVQSRSLADLAKEYGRLRHAVRTRTIAPSEMRGGTFTISNLGMYEVDAFTAIINQPESAILAIGRTVDTPVGRDGQIVLRPMATLSLSSDHRIVDGITAARFMAQLRRAIEDPAAML
ncbi:MAG: dihydrolipoamide acetyltransferase family protein [Betaproteobacteria bacterium]